MNSFIFVFIIPLIAVLLDAFVGDPQRMPHPVRWIGAVLSRCEEGIRLYEINLRMAGWGVTLLFPVTVYLLVHLLSSIPYVGLLIALYLSFAGLALGCLIQECEHVASLLNTGELSKAQKALAMLVSRDTQSLDENGIRQTLAETLSENLNDGFVAPMFYLTLLGPGGLWAYKVVSTMDSMWGYKTDRYKELGYAAAKTDDVLAYIPARITATIMLFVGRRLGLDVSDAQKYYKKDAAKMESPNAGWPMAAAAWLLNAQMGGKTVYFGEVKDKPILGPESNQWNAHKISELLRVCQLTGYMAAWIFVATLSWIRFAL